MLSILRLTLFGICSLSLCGCGEEGDVAAALTRKPEEAKSYTVPREAAVGELPANAAASAEAEVPAAGEGGVSTGESATEEQAIAAADAAPKEDALVKTVESVLVDVIMGRVARKDHEELRKKILLVLEQREMGNATSRFDASDLVVRSMFRAVDDQGGPAKGALTPMMSKAIRMKAEMYADDLYRRLPMRGAIGSAQHEGTLLKRSVDFAVPEGYEKVQFSRLGDFSYTEGMELPPEVRAYAGKKVGLAGYMMTLEEVENIREFLLVESLWSCCFGQPPLVHQVIVATMPKGQGADYTPEAVLLLGTMEVGEEIEDGFVTSIYRMKLDALRVLQ